MSNLESRIMKRVNIAVVMLGFIITDGLRAQDLQVSAYVNSTQISLNQQFELTVEVNGSDANRAPQPELPDINSFAAFLGTSTSVSTQIVNTQTSVSRIYSHHFVATQAGRHQIPAIKLEVRGKVYSTNPIDIEVVKSQAAPQQTPTRPAPGSRGNTGNETQDLSQVLFLRAETNKRTVYQNEPVIVTYKIYTAVSVNNYGISQLPNMVGFWSEEFPAAQRPRIYDQVINGRQFKVAEIKKLALFPQSPGNKTLEPLTVECEVQLPRRRSRDIFDSFFDDSFFGRTVRQQIRSNAIDVEVLPLPEVGKPVDFSGAVGSFSISAIVDKTQVQANEPVTLKLKISGTGNIKILSRPKIEFPTDFEVYDPKVSENIRREGDQIAGDKTFEYVIIPRFHGNQIIKPVALSYFDLSSKTYRKLSTDAIEIAVSKGKDTFTAVPMGTSKEDVKFIGQDIRFIQQRMPEFQKIGPVFYKTAMFFGILIFPLFAIAGALAYRRHLDKLSSNEAYARSRKANKMALKRLGKAQSQLRSGNPREFYSEVSKALMGFIGDKLNVPSAGLITDEVETVLHNRGIADSVVAEYLDCLKTCDFMRFAPAKSDNGELQGFFDKARKAIINLDKAI